MYSTENTVVNFKYIDIKTIKSDLNNFRIMKNHSNAYDSKKNLVLQCENKYKTIEYNCVAY